MTLREKTLRFIQLRNGEFSNWLKDMHPFFEQIMMQNPMVSEERAKGFVREFLDRAGEELPAMQEEFIDAYLLSFTEEQIDEILAFFDSPIGKAFVEGERRVGAITGEIGKKWGDKLAQQMIVESVELDKKDTPFS